MRKAVDLSAKPANMSEKEYMEKVARETRATLSRVINNQGVSAEHLQRASSLFNRWAQQVRR